MGKKLHGKTILPELGKGHYYLIVKVEHVSPPQEYQGLSLEGSRTPTPELFKKGWVLFLREIEITFLLACLYK